MLAKQLLMYVHAALRGGDAAARRAGVTVGQGCRILSLNFGSEPWLVTIGDHVTVTAGVRFITHDGAGWLIGGRNGRHYYYAPIEIGNDVFIGVNSVLLPGVRIGSRVVVGACSLINKSVPDGVVVAGSPARVIGSFASFAERVDLEWKTEDSMRGTTFRQRVESIVSRDWKPVLKRS